MVNKEPDEMSATSIRETLDDRVARLERSLAETIDHVELRSSRVEDRVWRLERGLAPETHSAMSPDSSDPRTTATVGAPVPPRLADPRVRTAREWNSTAVSDLVGGRVLAWLGGLAVVVAIVLFLVLAVSHGWIGEQARVLLAGAASGGLLAGGAWLHGNRGRTEAATTMVGAGTAGLFATLVVAGEVYRVAPPLACLGLAIVVGAVSTTLAIRWAGRVIAALGLGGALLAPVLVGAPSGLPTLAILGVTTVCAMTVASRQNWRWLGLGALVLSAPQWAAWSVGDRGALAEVVVIGGFALVGLAGGAAPATASSSIGRKPFAAVGLLTLNACLAALFGYVALEASAGHTAAVLWLAALAAVHAGAGLAPRRREISEATRQVLLGLAVLLADLAFGLSADGLLLTAGWAAVSVGLAWQVRRRADDSRLLAVGLGAHVALVLIRVVLAAPPTAVSGGAGSLVALLSISTLAASALACAQLLPRNRPGRQAALNALGLASIAYLTAGALDGAALASAWAVEGLALIRLAQTEGDETSWLGGLGFLGLAATHAVLFEAPPVALVRGIGDLGPAVVALAAIVCATFTGGRLHPSASTRRRGLLGVCAVAGLYLVSVALVSVLESHTSGAGHAVLALNPRQQAQVALSCLWSLAGLTALTFGLRRGLSALRIGGLTLLLVAVAKVFTYDLSALDSIYRVASVLTLGLLLLIAALTYQRLRPPPSPDLRTLHPSQR